MNERGGALDRKDVNGGIHGDDLGFVVGARRPDFTADADLSTVRCDLLDNGRVPPDQSGRSGPQHRGLPHVACRQWPRHAQAGPRRAGKSADLERQAQADAPDDGRCQGRDGQQPERQRCRHELGDPEQRGQNQPGKPRLHRHSRGGHSSSPGSGCPAGNALGVPWPCAGPASVRSRPSCSPRRSRGSRSGRSWTYMSGASPNTRCGRGFLDRVPGPRRVAVRRYIHLNELGHTNHLSDSTYLYGLYFCHLNEEDHVAGAKYKQIADDLRDQITAGVLPPGGQLPTEPRLADAYGASRSTVRLAVGLLIQQGLVETRQGMGTYVTEPATPITVLLSREEDWRIDEPVDAALPPADEEGSRQTAGKFQAETTDANAEVAAALDVAEGTPVVLRRTQRYLGEEPWSLVVSYYPMDIVQGTALEHAGRIESASLVLAEHGHQPIGYRDDIYARMPDAIETAFFRLSRVVPVTVVSRTTYDDSQPVQLTRYVYRADRLRLRHEMGSIPAT